MSTISSANTISKIIDKLPVALPIVMKKYTKLASSEDNLRKIFSRLTKAGILEKIVTGIYCKTKIVSTHKIYPNTSEIIKAITEQTGEKIVIFGADAIRMLGLSTQMTVKPIFYTSGKNRTITFGSNDIKLVNINAKFVSQSRMLQLILSAAYYLGKDKLTIEDIVVIEQNINLISKNNKAFEVLINKCESIQVRWLSTLLVNYARKKGILNAISIL